MAKQKKARKKTIENRRVNFGYEATDDLEVGMVLTGEEVKAIRAGHMHITGSYGRILQGPKQPELWLIGATISKKDGGDKQRSIKLLAHRSEIDRAMGLIGQKGYTLVPKRVYFKNNNAKLLLNISKGLKIHEKRQKIREKDINRDIERAIRGK